MKWLVLFVMVVAAAGVAVLTVVARNKKGAGAGDTPWPFYAKKLMSAPEQVLYLRLCNALPQHIVLAQVGLSRILGVKKGHSAAQWFNRINRMSADFVLCAKDARVVAIIELDDASHSRADRLLADAKKDQALQSAGIRVVRWQAKAMPDEATIKAAFVSDQSAVLPDAATQGPAVAMS